MGPLKEMVGCVIILLSISLTGGILRAAPLPVSAQDLPSVSLESGGINTFIQPRSGEYCARELVPATALNVPAGVCVGDDGNIYVSAVGVSRILPDGSEVEQICNFGSFFLVKGPEGNFYSEQGNGIIGITPAGDWWTVAEDVVAGVLRHLASSPDGFIYVDAIGEGEVRLLKVDIDSGDVEEVEGGVDGPKTFDSAGRMYVVRGGTVYCMTVSDQFTPVVTFNLPPDTLAGEPGGLALDLNDDFLVIEPWIAAGWEPAPADGRIGTRLFRIDRATGAVTTVTDDLIGPCGLAVKEDGNLLITEGVSTALVEIEYDPSTGTGNRVVLVPGNFLGNNWDQSFTPDGDLIILCAENGMLMRAAISRPESLVTITPLAIGFAMYGPNFLAVNGEGVIYLSEFEPGNEVTPRRVSRVSEASGEVEAEVFIPDSGEEEFSPSGVAVDGEGYLWVAHYLAGQLRRYDTSGVEVGRTAADLLSLPMGITWHNGSVYVAEEGSKQISRVSSGYEVSTFVDLDSYFEEREYPVDLAFSPGGTFAYVSTRTALYRVEAISGDVRVLASARGGAFFGGVDLGPDGNLTWSDAKGSVTNICGPIPPPTGTGDYDGDGYSDIAVYRREEGLWGIRGITLCYFGGRDDWPVPGDYDGDGTTEIGIFRPASGLWAIKGVTRAYFGAPADRPAPEDYNGDGICDQGIFRSGLGLWAVRGVTRVYFGSFTDEPVPGDFDGDGTGEIGIFRKTTGLWALRSISRVYYGAADDIPVQGDYHGDGTDGPAVFRPSSGLWAARAATRVYFGASSDQPIPGAYDGTVRCNVGLFQEISGLWAVKSITRVYYGRPGDIPVTR